MIIREVQHSDFPEWHRQRVSLYSQDAPELLMTEIESIFYKRSVENELDYSVWVAEVFPDKLAGFIEVSLRPDALHSETQPVGYIESLYIEPEYRHQGLGSQRLQHFVDGYEHVRTKILLTDDEAKQLQFYKKMGYTNTKDIKKVNLNVFVQMKGLE